VISCVCDSVRASACVSVGLSVRALMEKRLELSTESRQSLGMYCLQGQKVKGRSHKVIKWACMSIRQLGFSSYDDLASLTFGEVGLFRLFEQELDAELSAESKCSHVHREHPSLQPSTQAPTSFT